MPGATTSGIVVRVGHDRRPRSPTWRRRGRVVGRVAHEAPQRPRERSLEVTEQRPPAQASGGVRSRRAPRAGFETGRARRSVRAQRPRRRHRSRTEGRDGGTGEAVRARQSRERRTRRALLARSARAGGGKEGGGAGSTRAGESFESRVCRDGDGGSGTDARSESRRPGRRRLHWPIVTASALTVSTA